MQLHYAVLSSGLVPVVFLHGLLGDGGNLRRLASLSAGKRGAVLMDLRNHGQSRHADDMSWTALADDVLETLDALGVTRCHLVGHSLGGKVAMAVAEQASERIDSMAILDIAPMRYQPGHETVFAALKGIQADPPASRDEANRRLRPMLSNPSEAAFLLKNLCRDEDGVLRLRCDLDAIVKAYVGLLSSPIAVTARYQGPVQFLKGEQSPYIQEEAERLIRQGYPQADVVTIAQAGHWLHFEQADTVSKALNAFWVASGFE